MPTPTTSPLIEGIIEEFDEKFDVITDDGCEYYRYPNNVDPQRVKNYLLSSLQKVEQSTIDRCLKVLPKIEPDGTLDSGNKMLIEYHYRKSALSAIKKEFKR